MKKITLKIAALILLTSVVFSACKKEEPAPVAESCGVTITNAALAFQAKAEAYKKKVTDNSSTYIKTDCDALKNEGLNLLAQAKACPELALNTALLASLQVQANGILCPTIEDVCNTLPATLAPDIAAAQAAFTAYSSLPTNANCLALKLTANTLISKASKCPALLASPQIQTLVLASSALTRTP